MPQFETLIQAVERREGLDWACLTLGLLIERHRTQRPAGDDGGVRQILGDEYAVVQLTDSDVGRALDRLIDYVRSAAYPLPSAVWALSKSYDLAVVPTLIDVLRRTAADAQQYDAARNALHGVITCGAAQMSEHLLQVIRETASNGCGRIRSEAQDFLHHYDSLHESRGEQS